MREHPPSNGHHSSKAVPKVRDRQNASTVLALLLASLALAMSLMNTVLIVRYLLVQQEFMEQALKELKQL